MRELRDYQKKLILEIRKAICEGHKHILAMAPTGFGKTLTAAHIVKGAREKGNRVVFTVPAIALVNQTYESFTEEGLNPLGNEIGIIQAYHELTDTSKPIQIASLDTIASWKRKRIKNNGLGYGFFKNMEIYPKASIVIIDEAHNNKDITCEWMDDCPDVIFIGLTATPYTKGLSKRYTKLVKVETTESLIEKGFLCPMTVYTPTKPDLSKVNISNTAFGKDYAIGQLSDIMTGKEIVADIVSTWLDLGENRQTLCFCVDRNHAKRMSYEFNKAGIPSGYQDCFTKPDERKKIKEDFESGKYKIVCNVGTLTTGVDWDVRCIIFARPTKSNILFQQIAGRGLRTAEGKTDCIFLDHTNTTSELGFATELDENFSELDDGNIVPKLTKDIKKENNEKEKKEQYECPKCSLLSPIWNEVCPNKACGYVSTPQTDVEVIEGRLECVKGKKNKNIIYDNIIKQKWYSGLLHIAKEKNRKKGWAAYTYKDKFGVWPSGLDEIEMIPEIEVVNFVKAKNIRFMKAQEKRKKNIRQITIDALESSYLT